MMPIDKRKYSEMEVPYPEEPEGPLTLKTVAFICNYISTITAMIFLYYYAFSSNVYV